MTVFDVILWRRAIHYVCLAKSGGKTRFAEFAVLQRAFSSPESPRKWRLQFYICVLEREEAGKEGRGERAGHDSAVGGSCCDAKQRKVWKKKMNWTRHQRGREANCTWWGAVSHEEDILSPPRVHFRLSAWLGDICCPTSALWPSTKPRRNWRSSSASHLTLSHVLKHNRSLLIGSDRRKHISHKGSIA